MTACIHHVTLHTGHVMTGRPAVEVLAMIGAEFLMRWGGFRLQPAEAHMIGISGLPLRDLGDLRRMAQRTPNIVSYRIGLSGRRRYLYDR